MEPAIKLPSNIENIVWGLAIILVGLGTYFGNMFDGNPETLPDANLFITTVLLGVSKMRSSTVGQVTEVKKEAQEVRKEVREVKQDIKTIEETTGGTSRPSNDFS